MTKKSPPPLYKLDSFSSKALEHSFYIEALDSHLKAHQFVCRPHNHDFYLLLYITKGGGTHRIDFKNYPIKPNSFFLMTPGQVHSWDLQKGTDGYIIFFERSFYQMRLGNSSLFDFPFFHSLQADPLISMPSGQQMIHDIVYEMHQEFKRSVINVDLRMLRSYLDLLLLKLARNYTSRYEGNHASSTTQKLRKLELLIDQHYIDLKQPSDYADLLHISPSYLNSICKKTIGRTLSELISDRLMLEAKRLFSYADMTVAEIADFLKFSSSSYFIRFFKKHAGQSPEQFKDSLNRAIL